MEIRIWIFLAEIPRVLFFLLRNWDGSRTGDAYYALQAGRRNVIETLKRIIETIAQTGYTALFTEGRFAQFLGVKVMMEYHRRIRDNGDEQFIRKCLAAPDISMYVFQSLVGKWFVQPWEWFISMLLNYWVIQVFYDQAEWIGAFLSEFKPTRSR